MTRFLILLISLLVPSLLQAGLNDDELLPEQEAFKFSAKLLPDNRIRTHWEIADGYYMYRDKMSFEFNGHDIITSVPDLPAGKLKQDSLFGEVAVFTADLIVDIPISINGPAKFELVARGQGCNEPIGVCYPPMVQKVKFGDDNIEPQFSDSLGLDSKPAQSSPADSSSFGSIQDLRSLLAAGFQQKEFLDVDDAFRFRIEISGEHQLTGVFDISDGYYLYREKINLSTEDNRQNFNVLLPDGEIREDEYFGEVSVFSSDFSVVMDFEENINSIENLIIHVNYQGCALDGICYSPVYKSFDFSGLGLISTAEAGTEAAIGFNTQIGDNGSDSDSSYDDLINVNEKSLVRLNPGNTDSDGNVVAANTARENNRSLERELKRESILPLLFGAFIAGILLTFTPCVLPMIPILSSVIAGQGKKLTRSKGGILAGFYVLGTMVTYAGMGALAGATGDQLQAYFQNIWAIGLLSGLFLIMALSMFGLFQIQMPGFIQSSLHSRTSNMGGSIPLVFALGLFSALIVGACVSPVLISILGIAVSRGDAVLGAQLMTTMAMAMGLPLILLGVGAGHFIPKAGKWMVKVKQGFGVMLIAVAIYLMGLLPQIPVLLLWGSYFVLLSIFLGATSPTPKKFSTWKRIEKGMGIILLVWGIFLLAGGLLGQRDVFKPIPQNMISIVSRDTGIPNDGVFYSLTRVSSVAQLEQQMSLAQSQNKLVLIDYYADWCVDCVRMEKTTFQNPAVVAILKKHYVTLQIDVTDPNDIDKKLLKKRYGVFGPPATLFFDRDGEPQDRKNFYGFMDSEDFLALIASF